MGRIGRAPALILDKELPPEEAEATSWEALLTKMKSAAKAGNFFSPDPACSSTVHFWAEQVVGALSQAIAAQGQGQERKGVSTMAKVFPSFLLKAGLRRVGV